MLLKRVSRLLWKRRYFMFSFMERYMLLRIKVQRTEMLTNRRNFNLVIDFCLRTNPYRLPLQRTKDHFSAHFKTIKKYIERGNLEELRDLVYPTIGVGQKIGSLILEVLIHYGQANANLEHQLFVPIDTHVHRIFTDCLGRDDVPSIGASIDSGKYQRFQKLLTDNSAKGNPRIIFDYLWFVGKVFCGNVAHNNDRYSRGYRLCSMCWIKDLCQSPDKWT